MARPDPLAVLQRLRRHETRLARLQLAEQSAHVAAAEARRGATEAALHAELSADPSALSPWLPRCLADRTQAALEVELAARRHDAARRALLAARTAENALERLSEAQRETARRGTLRRQQAALDEAASGAAREGAMGRREM
ncbi:hypothetical protein M0638_25395 [Roseomonas sp. NAR14]|uniref:Flagellar FliJ protein n=1 Tax=Roseomonas acroporae TaxID=2937791 RepID=A0A9X1YC31_9PROT|nr:hypothetical protein [Roseomonas acroporae]MCK8787704.1 hypothetical protein [Roseomonas acroporae]